MFQYYCLNPIAQVGLDKFTDEFTKTEDVNQAEGILVRSAAMHDMEFSENLLAGARAGAGVNNIPLEKCAEKGIVVFNTPGANANGVKELVIAGMLLACRDIVGGINWVESAKEDENIAKAAEKEKKRFAGTEVQDKRLGIIGLGAIGVKVANAAKHMGIGLPMAFQFSITAIGVIVLQGAINLFGESRIAAYAAASKVEQLVSQPAGTFGVTMANFSGQNLGAGRVDRVRKGVRQASFLTLCFSVLGMIVLLTCGEALTGLFIKEDAVAVDEIISASMHYLRICAAFFPFLFMIFIYRNALQGIGHSFMPLMGGVMELVVRCAAALILPGLLGFPGVCLAGPLAWLSAAVLLCISYFVIIRRVEKEYGKTQEMEISGSTIL